MLCERDGSCDRFIGFLEGGVDVIPDHVCPAVMCEACRAWAWGNSGIANSHPMAYISDNRSINPQFDANHNLLEWPIPCGEMFLAHVIRQWVIPQAESDTETINKMKQVFHSASHADGFMRVARAWVQSARSFENYDHVSFRAAVDHIGIIIRARLKEYGLPYNPTAVRYATTEAMRAEGLAVPYEGVLEYGPLVTSFVLVAHSENVFAAEEHEIVQSITFSAGRDANSLKMKAITVATAHAKFWRAQYPILVLQNDQRRFPTHHDTPLYHDLEALKQGTLTRKQVRERQMARWRSEKAEGHSIEDAEREANRISQAIRRKMQNKN